MPSHPEDARQECVLTAGELHVWHADLTTIAMEINEELHLLDDEERARAARLRVAREAEQFVAAHAILRRLLGRYIGCAPEAVRFRYTAKGKPFAETGAGEHAVRFNASRAAGCAIFAFALTHEIGIDVERISDLPLSPELLARTLTVQEIETLRAISSERERQKAFIAQWVRKEAVLKAHGDGLGISPSAIDIAMPGRLARIHGETSRVWRVDDLAIDSNHAAAIAAEGSDWRVESIRAWTNACY